MAKLFYYIRVQMNLHANRATHVRAASTNLREMPGERQSGVQCEQLERVADAVRCELERTHGHVAGAAGFERTHVVRRRGRREHQLPVHPATDRRAHHLCAAFNSLMSGHQHHLFGYEYSAVQYWAVQYSTEHIRYPRAARELPVDVVALAMRGDAALGDAVPKQRVARIQRERFGEAVERAERIASEQKLHAYATGTGQTELLPKNK